MPASGGDYRLGTADPVLILEFASIAYFIAPDGTAERACGVAGEERRLDFIGCSSRVRPSTAPVSCPLPSCLCLDRYAFLEELPDRGRSIDLLGEYVRDCRSRKEGPSSC